MRAVRLGAALLIAGAVVLAYSSTPQAFHSGGVAECGGCHSMHNPKVGGSFLLVGTDSSSACLTCHEHAGDTGPSGYHISTAQADMPSGTAPLQRTPGGDFGWIKKNYSFTVRGSTTNESGDTHGHNIVAADFGYTVDATNTTAPGSTAAYPSSQLGCQSCHDPHGRARRLSDGTYANAIYTPGSTNAPIVASGSYHNSPAPAAGQAVGVYRLLRGLGDNTGGVTFAGVAVAVAPATYNRTEAATDTRVAYGSQGTNTWGNWCATCHQDMHSGLGNYVHPIDRAMGSVATSYNAYVKSGDLTGTAATSYTSLVPFMEKNAAVTTLQGHANPASNYRNGPASNDEVSCLSCHRAHASGWEYGLRWNMEGEFMTYNGVWPGTDTTPTVPQFARGRTSAETMAAYYDRPASQFASYQRVLCNKCHAKD